MPIRRRSLPKETKEIIDAPVLGKSTFERLGIPEGRVRLVSLVSACTFGVDDPKKLRVEDVLAMVRAPNWHDNAETFYRERIKSPLTGIRAFCVFCSGGSPKAANACPKTDCSLWAFRTGKNPFFGKLSNAEAKD